MKKSSFCDPNLRNQILKIFEKKKELGFVNIFARWLLLVEKKKKLGFEKYFKILKILYVEHSGQYFFLHVQYVRVHDSVLPCKE